MDISFTGHQIQVTPALKSFTEEKLQKLIHHFDRITHIHVTFHVEHLKHIVEVNVSIAKDIIHAHAESENMYTAIDLMIDKLDRQLIKHKEKTSDHRA